MVFPQFFGFAVSTCFTPLNGWDSFFSCLKWWNGTFFVFNSRRAAFIASWKKPCSLSAKWRRSTGHGGHGNAARKSIKSVWKVLVLVSFYYVSSFCCSFFSNLDLFLARSKVDFETGWTHQAFKVKWSLRRRFIRCDLHPKFQWFPPTNMHLAGGFHQGWFSLKIGVTKSHPKTNLKGKNQSWMVKKKEQNNTTTPRNRLTWGLTPHRISTWGLTPCLWKKKPVGNL